MRSSRVKAGYDLSPCISQSLINEMKQKGHGSLNPRLNHFSFTVRSKDLEEALGSALIQLRTWSLSAHHCPLAADLGVLHDSPQGPGGGGGNLGTEGGEEAEWHLRALKNHEILV